MSTEICHLLSKIASSQIGNPSMIKHLDSDRCFIDRCIFETIGKTLIQILNPSAITSVITVIRAS
jgi:hypothetical protein